MWYFADRSIFSWKFGDQIILKKRTSSSVADKKDQCGSGGPFLYEWGIL